MKYPMDTGKRKGFTLLEVLVALTVLIVGIVAVMQLFPASLLQARMAAERTVAAQLANSRLGELRASGAAALFYENVPATLLSARENDDVYKSYTTTIARLSGAMEVYLQRVTFTVAIADDREETFVTYVSAQ